MPCGDAAGMQGRAAAQLEKHRSGSLARAPRQLRCERGRRPGGPGVVDHQGASTIQIEGEGKIADGGIAVL